MKLFIYGATGTVSGALTEKLLQAGHEVFAGTRHPEKLPKRDRLHGVAIDSRKPTENLGILEKVDAAFLIGPPAVVDSYSALSPLVEKAKSVKLKKLVLMTAMGVEHAPVEAPMRRLELLVEGTGLSYNIIRPNWFMQNFHTFWIAGILADRKIYFPGGGAKTSFIDARDIASSAFELITGNKLANQAFALTGSEALDHSEVAVKLSKVTPKPVTYVDITPEAFQASLLTAGLPADYVGFIGMISAALKAGAGSPITDAVKRITGKDPIRFETYAADFKAQWAGMK